MPASASLGLSYFYPRVFFIPAEAPRCRRSLNRHVLYFKMMLPSSRDPRRKTPAWLCCFLLLGELSAQDFPSRAAEIEHQREQKEKAIAPEINSKWEDRLLYIRETKLLERLTGGVAGVRVKLGGLATSGGFALGPEYLRSDLLDGRFTFRAAAQASFVGFQKYDIELGVPRFAGDRLSWNLYAVHHNYPQLQYYGPGPESEKTGRSSFRLEDTAVDTTLGFQPVRGLTLAGQAGYLRNNVGPGTTRQFISAERQYFEADTPGIQRQADFARYGAFLQYDNRDRPGGPRSGGQYYAQWGRYVDQTRGEFTHHRLDLVGHHYIPLLNARRVIALRGRTTLTDTSGGQRVPFYLQPSLGGSETLRGYRAYRFYGDQALLMTAEYRYEIFSGLDMAIFADAGKVTMRKQDINFHDLESSLGFGFRFNARNNVFLRIETAFSHEGWQVWLKFNSVFASGPMKTSSSQGEF